MMEEFADVNKDLKMIQSCAENINNILRTNNLWMWGLKEYAEGKVWGLL